MGLRTSRLSTINMPDPEAGLITRQIMIMQDTTTANSDQVQYMWSFLSALLTATTKANLPPEVKEIINNMQDRLAALHMPGIDTDPSLFNIREEFEKESRSNLQYLVGVCFKHNLIKYKPEAEMEMEL